MTSVSACDDGVAAVVTVQPRRALCAALLNASEEYSRKESTGREWAITARRRAGLSVRGCLKGLSACVVWKPRGAVKSRR